MRISSRLLCLVVAFTSVGGSVSKAQDTRKVSEPKIPAVCTKLMAQLPVAGVAVREADEGRLDTVRIQKALDECKAGQAVELALPPAPAKGKRVLGLSAFLTGPLELREGVTLLIDRGVTLFGSRDPKVYEVPNPDAKAGEPGRCATSMPRPKDLPLFSMSGTRPRGGCRPLIAANNVKNVAIMGDGVIDGRGYAKLIGRDFSWWEMARKAQPNDDLYWSVKLIAANHADGFVLYGITLHNSPNYHVTVSGTDGFTAWGVHLQTPVDRKLDARNTDGIDPGSSKNITIAHSWIDNGDDNIAIKQGVSHMSVLDNHFYTGHGMSIGSETVLGQSYLLVDGLTEDHTTSGIRIKSNVKRGGPVHDLVYRNICMTGVANPIAISPYYTNQTVEPFEDPKYEGDKIPDYKRITLENVYAETVGDVLIAGLNDEHRTGVELKNVYISGLTPERTHIAFADVSAWGLVNKSLSYDLLKGHATTKVALSANAMDEPKMVKGKCDGKFVPYR